VKRQDRDGLEDLHWRRGGRSTRGTLTEFDLWGLCPLDWNIDPGRPKTSLMMIITLSRLVDVLEGRFGQVGEAQGGLTFCSRMLHFP
jgi:hypothetical protein